MMKFIRLLRQSLAIKNFLFTAILLAILSALAFLSHRYQGEIDLSANGSNTLSAETQQVLAHLPEPLLVTVYIKTSHPLKRQIKPLLERYRHLKPNIKVQFMDPEINIAKARELDIGSQGLIVVEYQGKAEKISFLDESSLTNALLQLSHSQERWLSFLTGHGERSPTGIANFDLGSFGKDLAAHHIKAVTLNLAEIGAIPDNSSVLVLAAPRVPLLAGETRLIQQYIQRGGNLLVLADPEDHYSTEIMQMVGIHSAQQTLLDTSSKLYGIDDPSFVLISQYNRHPITQGMEDITVYPAATALTADKNSGFAATAILTKGSNVIGYALTRDINGKNQQRIVVIGDGDFLSNTFLGNVGNAHMGGRIFNWLTHDDQFIEIPMKTSVGTSLQLKPMTIGLMSLFFLLILPLSLASAGFWIWRKRKRQ